MDLTEPKPLIAIEAKSPQQGMMRVPVERVSESGTHRAEDVLAVEEPLEIRLIYHDGFSPVQKSISITMRTPGHDFDLACGFLLSEGIVRGREQIASVRHLGQPEQELQLRNVVRVGIRAPGSMSIWSGWSGIFIPRRVAVFVGRLRWPRSKRQDSNRSSVLARRLRAMCCIACQRRFARRKTCLSKLAGCTRRRYSIRLGSLWRCAKMSAGTMRSIK